MLIYVFSTANAGDHYKESWPWPIDWNRQNRIVKKDSMEDASGMNSPTIPTFNVFHFWPCCHIIVTVPVKHRGPSKRYKFVMKPCSLLYRQPIGHGVN